MKNIHVLPTDKPSRIYLIKSNNKLGITSNNPEFTENFGSGTQNQHIYITSDEEIKEGDWCFDIFLQAIFQANRIMGVKTKNTSKKIILTTDQDLIEDGVQAIDDEFLEWFVKNPSCENVEVEIDYFMWRDGTTKLDDFFKIIIPKEEQKQHLIDMMEKDEELGLYDIFNDEKRQGVKELIDKHKQEAALKEALLELRKTPMTFEPEQETLEKASWKFNPLKKLDGEFLRHAFIEGAKWQQERSYSEEDMAESFMACWKANVPEGFECKLSFNEWFQQFKKK